MALPGVTVDILTTRKIELQQWELRRLNDPYWRLYWPMELGGVIEIDGVNATELPPARRGLAMVFTGMRHFKH